MSGFHYIEFEKTGSILLNAEEKDELFDYIDRLKAENKKLRELVLNLRRVIPADVVGVVVGANTDHPTYYKFDEVFRELGIEVDA